MAPGPDAPGAAARRDRRILLAVSFLRAVATSLVAVVLAIHLASLGFDPARIGLVSGAGLGAAALATLAVTLFGDRFGRRRTLVAASAATAIGGTVVALGASPILVGAGAVVGMLNAMGRDRGVAATVEQAVLPATAAARGRTAAFAWYTALQDAGHALGSLLAAAPAVGARLGAWSEPVGTRLALATVPVAAAVAIPLYLRLSPGVEERAAEGGGAALRLAPATRRVVAGIAALFALDGLGGGLLVGTLLAYFFFERFGVRLEELALLFFAARLANIVSHFAAAALARRIGLVNTMVFTHLPSSLLLVAVAFVGSWPLAAGLFLLREALVEMDVPTRQSYVMAVVAPHERTAAAGVTNLVRLATWAVGPLLAGALMQRVGLATPLLVGAALKIVYDLLLYASFRARKPPEEIV
jgi:MFS family permease